MTRLQRILTVITGWLPLLAGAPISTQWDQLCSRTAGRQLSVSTADGKTVQGRCMSTYATTLRLTQGPGLTKDVERSEIKQIIMNAPARVHHFLKLHKGILERLGAQADGLSTPVAPLALAAMPVTIAGGVFASPFALVRDLFEASREVSPTEIIIAP